MPPVPKDIEGFAPPHVPNEMESFNAHEMDHFGSASGDYDMMGGALNGRRSFTVQSSSISKEGGTYISTAPLNAAKKAARQLFNKSTSNSKTIRFVLREMTRGSAKKTYKYVATKKKLRTPKTVTRGNTNVTLEYEYEVKADN